MAYDSTPTANQRRQDTMDLDNQAGPAGRQWGCTVITGAASGIGAALAERVVADGSPVVIADLDGENLEATAAALRDRGGDVLAVPTDVTDADQVQRLADAAYDRHGAVRMLVNNAGIESVGHLWEMSPENWRRVQQVNADGVFHGIRAFVPRMGADPRPSHVVTVVSVAGITTAPRNGAYVASKHAALALVEGLYVECAERFPHLLVSAVMPAAVTTQIFEEALTEGAGAEAAAQEELDVMRRHLVEHGISATAAAEIILEGTARGDFWITTHPERFREIAGRRAAQLSELRPPVGNIAREVLAERDSLRSGRVTELR
jgi:NAD(P)-dependent dehydrogenase (short-subunit alcohol dehydrogenase family)